MGLRIGRDRTLGSRRNPGRISKISTRSGLYYEGLNSFCRLSRYTISLIHHKAKDKAINKDNMTFWYCVKVPFWRSLVWHFVVFADHNANSPMFLWAENKVRFDLQNNTCESGKFFKKFFFYFLFSILVWILPTCLVFFN